MSNAIAFIDAKVTNYETLLAGLDSNVEIHILNQYEDGLLQIASILEGYSQIDSIHIISHGSSGALQLGSTVLNNQNLSSYANALKQIGSSLSETGDLLLYGCNVANGDAGQQLIEQLAKWTNADIAASTNLTGSSSNVGDWVLEANTGTIESSLPFSMDSLDKSKAVLNAELTDVNNFYARPGQIGISWIETRPVTGGFFWLWTDAFNDNTLIRAHAEWNNGGTWVRLYDIKTNTGTKAPDGATIRIVDDYPGNTTYSTTTSITWDSAGGGVSNTSGFSFIPDNAPTDISSSSVAFFSDETQGSDIATLTPADTGLTTGGYWQINSQSVPNLFTISFNASTDNTAKLTIGSGTIPAGGSQPTVTVRYYDFFQTDNGGNPLAGQGFAKTLTFTVVAEATQDLAGFGNDFALNTTTANDQISPALTQLSNGNFVAVWSSAVQSDSAAGSIIAQIFSSTGTKIGSEMIISPTNNGALEYYPTAAALDNGRFVVAYQSTVDTDGYSIRYVLVAADGTPGSEMIANVASDRIEFDPPVITTLSDGSFMIAWDSYTSDWSTGNILARNFSAADGAPLASEVIIKAGVVGTSTAAYPSIAPLSGGSYVSTWAQYDGSWNPIGIYGQIGTGTPFLITGNTDTLGAKLATLTGGDFVAVWEHGTDIYFQRYNSAGTAQGSVTQANVTATGTQSTPSVVALSGGGFLIGWQSDTGDYSGYGIFGRRFAADGTAVDVTDFEINEHRRNDQSNVSLAPLSGGSFVAAWQDAAANGAANAGVEGRVLFSSNAVPVIADLDTDTSTFIPGASEYIDNQYGSNLPVALTDTDSTDFNSGYLLISQTSGTADGSFLADLNDAVLSFGANPGSADGVIVASDKVFVNGTDIGAVDATLTGQGGANLRIDFNANSTPLLVENLIKYLKYGTPTVGARAFSVVVNDGDGGTSTPVSFTMTATTDGSTSVTTGTGITEPVTLPSTVTTSNAAVNVFDFKITDNDANMDGSADGGTSDGLATTISQIALSTSGTGDFSKVTWLLSGTGITGAAIGTYNVGSNTITFSGLNLSVGDNSSETYTVSAYYNDNTGLTEGQTYLFSVDGDSSTNFIVSSNGSQMAASQTAVTNSTGTTVDVTATKLVFGTQPANSISGVSLTQPVLRATDAAGNVDTGFTGSITLSENAAGSLFGTLSVAAAAGVATFSGLIYTATADQETFQLDAIATGLTGATSSNVTSDVVATQLVFTTQPTTSIQSGVSTALGAPVVTAEDANHTVDIGYATDIVLSVTDPSDGTISAGTDGTVNSLAGTNDTDGTSGGNTITVTQTPSNGTTTFIGLAMQFTNVDPSESITLKATSGGLTVNSSTITSSSNQAPTFDTSPTAITFTDTVADDAFTAGNTSNLSGTVTATDTDPITFGLSGGTTGGSYASGSVIYDVSKAGTYGTLYLVSAGTDTGKYLLIPNDSAINARTANTSETFTVTVADALHTGSPTTATLTVNVTAANDTPVLTAPTAINLTDTVAPDSYANQTGTLLGSDRDTGATPAYGITGGVTGGTDAFSGIIYDVSQVGSYGTLYVVSTGTDKGKYVYVPNTSAINALAADATPAETFAVTVSDGSLSDNQTLAINLTAINDNPVNTVVPVVTGTHTVGQQLSADHGTFTDAEGTALNYTYQWYRADDGNGTNAAVIASQTSNSYTLTTSDAHQYVQVVVTAGDGSLTATSSSAWMLTGNAVPDITSDGSGAIAALNLTEYTTAVTTVTSSDIDSDTPTYTISGGTDQALFNIGSSTGILSFITAPHFGTPTDQGGNNIYDVNVTVSDGHGGSDIQAIAVTVLSDIDRDGIPDISDDDDDSDGRLDSVEDPVPNGSGTGTGDGNGDGILDREQINVASIGTVGAVSTDKRFATIEVADGLTLANVANTDAPAGLPRNAKMPLGQFDFDIGNVTVGSTVSISMYVDKTLGMNGYYKLNGSTWTNIATTSVVDNKTKITFSLTDGGLYDADHVANGVIKDPGGAAIISPIITSNGGGTAAAITIAENTTTVTTITVDTLGTVGYSLGGIDGERFQIDASGVLTFKNAPVYSSPNDSDGNNTYLVDVIAADNGNNTLTDVQTMIVTVVSPTFTVTPISTQTTREDGGSVSYSVVMDNAPATDDVVISFSSNDSSEGEVIVGSTITFTTSNWSIPQTLTVRGVDDNNQDGNQAYAVTATVTTTDSIYSGSKIDNLSLSNLDDGSLNLNGDAAGSRADNLAGKEYGDALHGLNMTDSLSGASGDDSLWGGYGDDQLNGGADNDMLWGDQGNDALLGGTGNDTLDGGLGKDTLNGGAGNDTYTVGYYDVDCLNDTGSSVDVDTAMLPYQLTRYILPSSIENGTITPGIRTYTKSSAYGSFNAGKDIVVGNTNNNVLTGNEGNNAMSGETGRDTLIGGLGADTLTGGAGQDVFRFDSLLYNNVDSITDFRAVDDTIELSQSIFTQLTTPGNLNNTNFKVGTAAADNDDFIVYNASTGVLSYDADGKGSGLAVQIAVLGTHPTLTAADFVVI